MYFEFSKRSINKENADNTSKKSSILKPISIVRKFESCLKDDAASTQQSTSSLLINNENEIESNNYNNHVC